MESHVSKDLVFSARCFSSPQGGLPEQPDNTCPTIKNE
jgi:hypothetical protein